MVASRIRILFVTDQLLIGGAERQLIEMCKRFDRDRFELFLFCTVAGGHLQREFEELGVVVHIGGGRFRPVVAQVCRLARFITKQRIDVVHSWLWYSNVISYMATRLSRQAVWILAVHGIHINFGKRHAFVEKLTNAAADHITTISNYNHRILLEEQRIDRDKVTVIYNGISTASDLGDSGTAGDMQIPGAGKLVGCIANFGNEKGHNFLIEAMALVAEQVPDLKMLLVGDGPLRPQIEAEIADQGLWDRIVLLGRRDDVPRLLTELDFTVLPSLLEGMPVSIIEAMAAGLPVVASNVGGIPEVVVDGETGLLVEPGQPELLAAAIVRLANDAELRAEMGAKAYRRVEQVFGIDQSVKAYERLYLRELMPV
jgi:glycosyltransferase involved in cell wall biosynthesis